MATEKQMANLAKGVRFNSETAREMQKKSVKARLTRQMLVEEAMRQFHKGGRDKMAFDTLSDKASKGDLQALEALRKWVITDDKPETAQTISLNIITDQETKDLIAGGLG